jgi:hypothetical protein
MLGGISDISIKPTDRGVGGEDVFEPHGNGTLSRSIRTPVTQGWSPLQRRVGVALHMFLSVFVS